MGMQYPNPELYQRVKRIKRGPNFVTPGQSSLVFSGQSRRPLLGKALACCALWSVVEDGAWIEEMCKISKEIHEFQEKCVRMQCC